MATAIDLEDLRTELGDEALPITAQGIVLVCHPDGISPRCLEFVPEYFQGYGHPPIGLYQRGVSKLLTTGYLAGRDPGPCAEKALLEYAVRDSQFGVPMPSTTLCETASGVLPSERVTPSQVVRDETEVDTQALLANRLAMVALDPRSTDPGY